MHAVVQNEPDCSDGTEGRSLTSPQSTAKRIPRQVGDSCLQHDALRFGLFSFSCPRLRYIRPTEAIAGPTAPAIALTAHTTMQGAHHASCRKALRGTCRAVGRHRAPSESANVSKLKRIAGIVASPSGGAVSRLTIDPQSASRRDRTRAPSLALSRDSPPPGRNPHSPRARHEALAGYRRPHAGLEPRPRQPRVATRGVTPEARVARRLAVLLVHHTNTLAFGHAAPRVPAASLPRIRHDPTRSRPP